MSAFASADWVLIGRQVANHLWQSTLFAAVAALLAFSLRKNHARVRHWIWMAASVKFLVPFSAIAALGGYFGPSLAPRAAAPRVPVVAEQIAQPFAAVQDAFTVPSAPAPAANPVPGVLVAVWFCGCAAVLVNWHRKWRRVAAVVRGSAPVGEGRELEALGRLRRGEEKAKQTGRSAPLCAQWGGPPGLPCFRLKLVSSDAKLEPGIFGIFRPVLWLPKGIGEYLSDAQLDAILAHELCHARRRDNLLAAIHMVVEAAFWFHPLVWWLGARLEAERERACDEEVVGLVGEPQAYAEGVLKVCEFYLTSPVYCAAGVTGADLKKRIEGIMTNRLAYKLNFGKKALLTAAAVFAVAGPIVTGLMNAPRGQAEGWTPRPPKDNSYEVVSIKRGDPGATVCGTSFSPGQFRLDSCSLPFLIAAAYRVRQDRVAGLPAWASSEKYTIVAKSAGPAKPSEQWAMLAAVFEERFKLKHHRETRQMRVYELSARPGGIQFPATAPGGCTPFDPNERSPAGYDAAQKRLKQACGLFLNLRLPDGGFKLTVKGVTMAYLAGSLQNFVDRPVVDRTGSTKLFDVELSFDNRALSANPGDAQPATDEAQNADGPAKAGGANRAEAQLPSGLPNIFGALKKAGLSLTSGRGGVEVMVIDQMERPTEN